MGFGGMKGLGITLLRKRIDWLKEHDLPDFDRSRESYPPHDQVFKDKLAELDRMEKQLEEKLKKRAST